MQNVHANLKETEDHYIFNRQNFTCSLTTLVNTTAHKVTKHVFSIKKKYKQKNKVEAVLVQYSSSCAHKLHPQCLSMRNLIL